MQKFRQIQAAYEILTGKQQPKYKSRTSSNYYNAHQYKSTFSQKKTDDFRRKYGISREEWIKRKEASERIRQKNSEEAYQALKSGLKWAILFTVFVNIIFPFISNSFTKIMVHKNPVNSLATINYTLGDQVGFVFKTPYGEKRKEVRCNYFNETTYLPNGFPAQKNDTYLVVFNRNNPDFFIIDFMHPEESLRRTLINECLAVIENNPSKFNNLSVEDASAFLQDIVNTFGMDGLSLIFNHSTKFYHNIKYNSIVFYFFTKNKVYKKILHKYAKEN